MWQLPPQRVKQPPRQGVEPPPDIVRPPAEANPAHLPTKDLTHKEWVLWKKHSPGQHATSKRSIEEHRGCAQRSQSTSFKEDAPKAKVPRCDSNTCLESAHRQPAAQIEIDKNVKRKSSPRDEKHPRPWRSSSPTRSPRREEKHSERGIPWRWASRSPRREAVLKRSSASSADMPSPIDLPSPSNREDWERECERLERSMSPDTKAMWTALKNVVERVRTEDGKHRRYKREEVKDHRRTETATRSHRDDDRKSSKHNKDEQIRWGLTTSEVKRIRRDRKIGSPLVVIASGKLTRRGKRVGGFVESGERRRPVLYQRVKGSLGKRLVMVDAHSSEEECTASRSCSVDSNGPPVHRHDGPPSPLWDGEPDWIRGLRTGEWGRPFGEASDDSEDQFWASIPNRVMMESRRSEVAGTASGSSGVASNGLPVHRLAEPPPLPLTRREVVEPGWITALRMQDWGCPLFSEWNVEFPRRHRM